MEKLPDDTQLQVILMDELRHGDVVIVNLKERLPTDAHTALREHLERTFPAQVVLINDQQATIEIKRPAQERRGASLSAIG